MDNETVRDQLDLGDVDRLIQELEAEFDVVGIRVLDAADSDTDQLENFSSGSCTNTCTGGCTDNCTHTCTGHGC